MGTFYTNCKIENPVARGRAAELSNLLVDTGSEFTWIASPTLEQLGIPRERKTVSFVMANGRHVTRRIGFAIVRLARHFTIDEVVFAEPGDMMLLGARTMEGLNLMVDPAGKQLLAAGPLPAASPVRRQTSAKMRRSKRSN